ncbi:glycosyltransferase [Pseudoxanthobacter sp. M-2]|uniref:glycosyltransferase n=1 Tax=Pseudoxanthobacter sp. M-2 TaxID=3078754 RepID=UPI0038FC4734
MNEGSRPENQKQVTLSSGVVARVSRITLDRIYGWVYDRSDLTKRLKCELRINGAFCGSFTADRPRDFLKAAGVGDGEYGFSVKANSGTKLKSGDAITIHYRGQASPLTTRLLTADDLKAGGVDAAPSEAKKPAAPPTSRRKPQEAPPPLTEAAQPTPVKRKHTERTASTAGSRTAGSAPASNETFASPAAPLPDAADAPKQQSEQPTLKGKAPPIQGLVDSVLSRTLRLADSGRAKDALNHLGMSDVIKLAPSLAASTKAYLQECLLDIVPLRAAGEPYAIAPLYYENASEGPPDSIAIHHAYAALASGDTKAAQQLFTKFSASGYSGVGLSALSMLFDSPGERAVPLGLTWFLERWRRLATGTLQGSDEPLLLRCAQVSNDTLPLIQSVALGALCANIPLAVRKSIATEAISMEVLTAAEILQRYTNDGERHKVLLVLSELPPQELCDEKSYVALVKLLIDRGLVANALTWATAGLQRFVTSFELTSVSADAARQAGQYDAAIDLYRAASELRPDLKSLRNRIISCESAAVAADPLRSSQALEDYRKRELQLALTALSRKAGDFAARLEYAQALRQSENTEEAEEVLLDLAEANPTPEVLALLQKVQARLGRDEAVAKRGLQLLESAPNNNSVRITTAKAFRACGDLDTAREILKLAAEKTLEIKREIVRTEFFAASFEPCIALATEALAASPNDVDLRLLATAALLELDRVGEAAQHLEIACSNGALREFPLEVPLLQYAVQKRLGNTAAAVASINLLFRRISVRGLAIDAAKSHLPMFDRFIASTDPDAAGVKPLPITGPLVSVIMTTYNVQQYVRTAIESILNQSYRNIELIVIDDCSDDDTARILRDIESIDPRVRIILKTTNDGTYVCKNTGLLAARGEFVALQDSDDWSHPDRIAASIDVLLARAELQAITTDWLRMTSDGDIVIKAGGQVTHLCCISLVMRRSVVAGVGYFDSVRVAADLEFIQRISRHFGRQAFSRIRWPLLLGRARSDSLTASEEFGMLRFGFTEPRRLYHETAERFQASTDDLFYAFPMKVRPFAAPSALLP